MRKLYLLPLLFLSGCAQLARPVTDAGLGALGALTGNALSRGNPVAIAGGAGAGVLVGEGIHALKSSSEKSAFKQGFQKGRSDGIKQIFENLQDAQRNSPRAPRNFEVLIPERSEGGVLFNETKQTIQRTEP